MMTTSKVFGEGSIHNRPEFGGIQPQQQSAAPQQQNNLVDEQLRLEQNKTKIIQDAVAKFLNKEITKAELETIMESMK